jgi:4'-phosphopantetheinyl transferase
MRASVARHLMPMSRQPHPRASSGAARSWPPGPSRPRLSAGALHVWLADLERVGDEASRLLCDHEQARAARLLSERDRRLWARSRGVLRELLGRYTGEQPATVRLVNGAHGKPALADDTLSFNLSHSDTLALYAFSATAPVGVDVEVARGPIDEVALAQRVLGEREAQRLRTLADPAQRHAAFLCAWTRHEARLKCVGTGIGGSAEDGQLQMLWSVQLDVCANAAAAVAATLTPMEVRCWSWTTAEAAG